MLVSKCWANVCRQCTPRRHGAILCIECPGANHASVFMWCRVPHCFVLHTGFLGHAAMLCASTDWGVMLAGAFRSAVRCVLCCQSVYGTAIGVRMRKRTTRVHQP